MSTISRREKIQIEKLFNMGGGYVMDFSNKTFSDFIFDELNIDIYDEKYEYESGSKANRLRGFFKNETDYLCGKLLNSLLQYWLHENTERHLELDDPLVNVVQLIVDRLNQSAPIKSLEVLEEVANEKDFEKLASVIKTYIESNDPQSGIDRLHTFMYKYLRSLCDKHNVSHTKNDPLHSIMGKYVKILEQKKVIEGVMTIRILKSNISILEAFNKIRNDQSFAHDNNQLLNYNECLLIFNSVIGLVGFINSIEIGFDNIENEEIKVKAAEVSVDDELPF